MLTAAGCDDTAVSTHQRVVGGEAKLGRQLIEAYGCPACHVVPGVPAARGTVGPSLADFGRRAYIAGRAPNRPDLLVLWLRNAPQIDPATAMPDMGVTEEEARHIAAYLYTLR